MDVRYFMQTLPILMKLYKNKTSENNWNLKYKNQVNIVVFNLLVNV